MSTARLQGTAVVAEAIYKYDDQCSIDKALDVAKLALATIDVSATELPERLAYHLDQHTTRKTTEKPATAPAKRPRFAKAEVHEEQKVCKKEHP